MLVSADADVEAAADAAAWGAMSNAGQTCIGIERVYVADEVYHPFLERLTEKVSLRPGFDSEASYGPMTLPSQPETVAKHVSDALAQAAARRSAARTRSKGWRRRTCVRWCSPTCPSTRLLSRKRLSGPL